MAAAWFNKLTDPSKAIAVSAGTIPGSKVHPEVVHVMLEVGIDLTHQQPQLLTESLARNASLLITMGCGEECPVIPGLRREDWPLQDPKGQDVVRVRALRDAIEVRVRELLRRETL